MKSIYIAGPYSADTEEERDKNVLIAKKAAQYYADLGYAVFCPHLQTQGWEDETKLSYGYFLAADLYWLRKCDDVAMLPGWEESYGATIEHTIARGLEKRIYHISTKEDIE